MSPGMAEIVNKSMPHKPTSLKSLLIDSAQRYGDRTAVVALHQPSHLPLGVSTGDQSGPYLRWTYSELLDGATLLAATLRQRGVQQGEPIASLLHNSADWALCFWAAALLGCPWIAIQSRTAVNADELAHILDLSRPKVILAWNQEQIEQLQASAQPQIAAVPIKIYATHSDQAPDGWSMLSSVFTEDTERLDLMADDTSNVAEDLVLVLFTSGTTGRPKGCMHTNKTITNMSRNHAHSLGLDETSSSISHLTLAHCFGLLYSVSFWSVGAKVVYPDFTFNATSTFDALRLESCTHMPAVPSLLHSLLDASSQSESSAQSLRHIEFSGAMISTHVVDEAKKHLCVSVVSTHYGMTESGPAASWPYEEMPAASDRTSVSPGLPVPGGKLKICAPGSRVPLKRGEAGEIQQSGPQVISGYLGGASKDQFYEDQHGVWMLTGDQGVMLDSGEIRVSGRYKDIIIRGGENIAPAQIEEVLNCRDNIKVQVVGAPDDLLGEVPVAVVQGIESQADLEFLRSMQSVVIQQLGLTFAIDEVITLRELGLEQFPQTTSGKVKKIELAAAVRRFREQDQPRRDSATEGIESAKFEIVSPQDPIAALVSDVWSRVLGIDPADLKPDTSIATLADSLTMMQARRLFQKHGLQVSLSELIENPTITAQAELFSGGESRVGAVPSVAQTRDGPPTAIDMVEACGDDSVAQKIQYCATPLLAKHGLTWQNDVEDVLPMYDILANMAAVRRRSRSAMRRDAFWARGVSPSRMSEVLHRALGEHPALRSMWFPTSTSSVSQLVLRPTERCLSAFVSVDIHTVDTPEDLSTVWAGDNARDLCDSQRGPGALFNAIVFNIRSEPDAAGFVYWSNHAAFDATSLSYFWETLDELLDGRSLTPRTNYKLWVDAYYAGRAGPHAQAGAREFGRRLKGFSEWSEQSIVPRAKAPGFMSGNDDGWIDLTTGKPGDAVKRIPLDCESGMYIGNKGLTRVYELPDLKQLQNQHGFAAHTILKASLALANVDWTGTNTSFFRSLQSGRQWPFMDQKLAAYLPSASDVAGPTFQASCDVVHFSHDRHETVGDLLQKMKADQELASKYEHTPLSLALAQLSEADRDAMMERGLSQLFNYLPAARNEGITKLEQVQSEMNADTGLQWDFTSLGAGRIALFVRWDGCQLRKAEVEDMLEDFGDVVAFVSQPQNRVKMLSDREMQTRYHVDHAEHHSPGIEPEVVDVGV